MTAPAPPEVRQCLDPNNFLYGATAVAGDGAQTGMWGIMHPTNGGHWSTEDDVADWTTLHQPDTP